MKDSRLYFDHAAGSPLRPQAREALEAAWREDFGNPDSPHREGQRARAALERARTRVAKVLDVPVRSVIFTGGGTEAVRIGLVGAARAAGQRRQVLGSALEHPAVLGAADHLARHGHAWVPARATSDGVVDEAHFLASAGEETGVAALLAVHHETGVRQPLPEVGAVLRDRGVPLVCDAALAPGRIALAPLLAAAPLVAFSAPKFGGPPGVGVLVVAPGTTLDSPARGGLQEERLRGGTIDVAGACATAAALETAVREREEAAQRYGTFEATLSAMGVAAAVGTSTTRAPGIVCVEFEHAAGETVMMHMDLQGFAVATGSSCALGGTDPGAGLLAMGWNKERAARTIRISFGWNTEHRHVKALGECILATRETLRPSGPQSSNMG